MDQVLQFIFRVKDEATQQVEAIRQSVEASTGSANAQASAFESITGALEGIGASLGLKELMKLGEEGIKSYGQLTDAAINAGSNGADAIMERYKRMSSDIMHESGVDDGVANHVLMAVKRIDVATHGKGEEWVRALTMRASQLGLDPSAIVDQVKEVMTRVDDATGKSISPEKLARLREGLASSLNIDPLRLDVGRDTMLADIEGRNRAFAKTEAGGQWKDLIAEKNAAHDLTNVYQDLGATILKTLNPAFTTLSNLIQNNTLGINDIISGVSILVISFGALKGVFTAVNFLFGTSITITSILTAVLAPLAAALGITVGAAGAVVIAIGAIIFIGVEVYKHWDQITKWLKSLWSEVKNIASSTWEAIKMVTISATTQAGQFLTEKWISIKTSLLKVWQEVLDSAKNIWSSITSFISDKINNIISDVNNAISKIQQLFSMSSSSSKSPGSSHATGGNVYGGPVLVGESGPEVFMPSGAGTILPNRMLGGGGSTINVYMQGGTYLSESVARDIGNMIMAQVGRAVKYGHA